MGKKILWKNEELEFLKQNYEKLTPKEIENYFNGMKTYKQIKRKLNELGLKHLNEREKWNLSWKKNEDEYISNNYKIKTISEISNELNKEYNDVVKRYKFLNIKRPHDTELFNNKFILNFSNKQINYIKLNHLNKSASDIANDLNIKYVDMIRICEILDLNWLSRQDIFNRDSKKFDKEIKMLSSNHTMREISNKLNIDYNFIFRRCKKLNINCVTNKTRRNLNWTEHDVQFLLDNYKTETVKDLSRLLKKPLKSIHTQLNKMNLEPLKKKYVDTSKLTEEKYQYLLDNYKSKSLLEICNYLEKDSRSIILKMILSGLFKRLENGTCSLLENVIAKILEENDIDYISQYIINGKSRKVQCDFLIKDTNKIIEVYGDYWHAHPDLIKKNDKRNIEFIREENNIKEKIIQDNGFKLLIIWENEIVNNLDLTYNNILNFISER